MLPHNIYRMQHFIPYVLGVSVPNMKSLAFKLFIIFIKLYLRDIVEANFYDVGGATGGGCASWCLDCNI